MQDIDIHTIDFIIIIASLILPIAVSARFMKRQKSVNRFFTAGGSIPAWAVGMSILATLISSVTFLAYPGSGFSSNWILLVQGLMVPLVLVFFIGFIVPLYRNVIKISAYEYFEQRFGFLARLYSSLGFFLAHFSKMGTVFFLMALAFSKMLVAVDTTQMIWLIGIIVLFITLIGGIEAVIWMDVIQGLTLIVGGILSLIIIVANVDGGIAEIWKIADAHGRIGLGPFSGGFAKLTFWIMALNGIFYAIQKYGTDQTIVQRYLTAKSNKSAVRASLMGVLLCVPVWALFMFIGTALFAYYQVHPGVLPTGIKPDGVFPMFIMTELPVGLVGLVLAALLAAAISSLDSDLNCLSAIFMEDYYCRLRPKVSEKHKLIVSRVVIIIAGIAAMGIAMYYVSMNGKGVLGIVFTLYSIFSGGIAGLFLLGIFCKNANKQGVYIGMLVCVLFTAFAILTSTSVGSGEEKHLILDCGKYNFTHHKYLLGVYSHVILFVVGYISSLFFKNDKKINHLTYFGWREERKLIEV